MMAKNFETIAEEVDADGFMIAGYSRWDCGKCGREVRRYRGGAGDVTCECGAEYNASGQRLRDDWRDNASNYDDEIGDMDGYEMAAIRRDNQLDGMY